MSYLEDNILEEYLRCIKNPKYCIERYLRVMDSSIRETVNLKLFPTQHTVIDAVHKNRFNLIVDYRQSHAKHALAAYVAVQMVLADYEEPETVLILHNLREFAEDFLVIVKEYILQLPRWFWGKKYIDNPELEVLVRNTRKEIVLPNSSRLRSVPNSRDALRGFRADHLIMVGAAYIDDGAEVFGAGLTSLGTGGKCTLLSIPNGNEPLFYNTYKQAKEGESDFVVTELKWYKDFRFHTDLNWYRNGVTEDEEEFTDESIQKRIDGLWKPHSKWYDHMCKMMNHNFPMIMQELNGKFPQIGNNGGIGFLNQS